MEAITTGNTGKITSTPVVKGIVQYPLYMGLPATGNVNSILETEIMKTVDLSWNYVGLSQICHDSHAWTTPHPDQTCVAGETYRNASFGADLGWFTLTGDCDVPGYEGLCFILANGKISVSDNGVLSTLLDQMDSGRPVEPGVVSIGPILIGVVYNRRSRACRILYSCCVLAF